MIERAGFYPHQHVVFAELGIRDIFVYQNLRATELMNADSFHVHFSWRVTLPQTLFGLEFCPKVPFDSLY
jgi:hypothetical protein